MSYVLVVWVRVSSNQSTPRGAAPSEFRANQVPGDAAQDREQQSVQGFAQRSEPKIHAAFEFICHGRHALLLLGKQREECRLKKHIWK